MKVRPQTSISNKRSLLVGLGAALSVLAASPTNGQSLLFEAESGQINAPFVVTNGCIWQHVQTGPTNGGRAVYHFTITNAGSFVILARVLSPQSANNAFYVNIDREPEEPAMVWDVPRLNEFTNQLVSWRQDPARVNAVFVRKVFALCEGTHQLIIRGGGGGILLDHFSIVRLPSPPVGLQISAAP